MFKLTIVLFAVIAYAAAKPGLLAAAPVAYSTPLVAAAPAVVTAHSSQVVARNYNGIAAAPLVAAPAVAAPVAYSAAYAAPVAYAAASPYAYAASPYAYAASPYAAVW